MRKQHRIGFYHTFLATENTEGIDGPGIYVKSTDEPVFGLEIFVEYQLFDKETNEEVLFDDEDYMPLHWYAKPTVTKDGIELIINTALLDASGFTMRYRITEHYMIVNGDYTFSAGPHKGLTVEMPIPKPITPCAFDTILFEHLTSFLHIDSEPAQSSAFKRVAIKEGAR